MNPRWKSQVGSGHNLSVGERRSPDYFSSRSPIDCEGVRRKTVKLTSPTPTTTMAMPTKAASKWSRLQAAKTKVTNATRQTDGAGAGVNEGEWANEKYLPKRILLHFRTGLFLCSFPLATSLSPPLLCICSERKQTLRGRPCAILAVIHCEHARPPPWPCSPLPPSPIVPASRYLL